MPTNRFFPKKDNSTKRSGETCFTKAVAAVKDFMILVFNAWYILPCLNKDDDDDDDDGIDNEVFFWL